MEALSSSETSVLTRATRRNIPKDGSLQRAELPRCRKCAQTFLQPLVQRVLRGAPRWRNRKGHVNTAVACCSLNGASLQSNCWTIEHNRWQRGGVPSYTCIEECVPAATRQTHLPHTNVRRRYSLRLLAQWHAHFVIHISSEKSECR
jgi:hypothetical protein